ncbi:hypothetical protein EVAR_90453_1 [Eumeta japonica]|uniref:Uncharacterized protein n=1 Tax=Eumeta variegata TaxID=151549 RepID=A0A4C1SHL6_EUMVA|nr:hypothetical protein EVAR_90453_1 [Eumeta japonica]
MSTKSQSRTEEVAASHIKRHKPRLRTLQSRMVKRPLRVQTDLRKGSVKAIPTRKTVRRSNSDGAQHKVQEWEQASCPSSPLEIEEGSIPPHHLSPLKGSKRTASERQRGPGECRQYEARVQKHRSGVPAITYEIVLALSDPVLHKYNLEAERTKHAQELVRIERAHNKDLTNVVKTLTEELSQAREDVRKSLDETKSIRDWLGYETEESKETNKDVKKRLLDIETSLREIKMEKSKTKVESVALSTKKMETDIKTLSAQLDEFRTKWGALKNETSRTLETSNKTLHEIKNLPKQLSANEKVEEQLKAVQSAVQNVSERLNSARDPVVQIDLHEQLQPLQEKMEAMSSAMKTMRDKRAQTPPTPGRNLERELAEAHKKLTNPKPSYAEAAAKSPTPQPNHTLIVSSKDKTHTGEHVLQIIREAIDTKKSGAKVERVRKPGTKSGSGQSGEPPAHHERGNHHKDADIIENVLAQNKHLVKDINLKEVTIRVRYRKRARNQLQCHPVLELSPSVHKRFLEAGKLYIDLQKVAVYDQSPLVQCAKCLGFGHTKAVCGEKTATCSYCADKTHEWENARRKQNEEPKCKNCWENGIKTEANHEAFSNKCKVRQKWDEIARSRIAIAKGNDMETGDAPTEVGHKTILMIQANLQRSKVATAELLQLATEKGISIAWFRNPKETKAS